MTLRRALHVCGASAIAAFSQLSGRSPTIICYTVVRSAEHNSSRRWTTSNSGIRNSPGRQKNGGGSIRGKEVRQGPHPRNSFQGSYDMNKLCNIYPPLGAHIIFPPGADDDDRPNNKEPNQTVLRRSTIKFADLEAVRALNTALLVSDYKIAPNYADILPKDALVPPIPGRADYVHYIADVLSESSGGDIPKGSMIRGCDIGTGASLIYPLLANSVYGWEMVGSEVNPSSVEAALAIAEANHLQYMIDVRQQESATSIFDGVWGPNEEMDFVMCNPPFFPSLEAFQAENARKVRGLAKGGANKRINTQERGRRTRMAKPEEMNMAGRAAASNNFGGTSSELWCQGGEVSFVKRMINESKRYGTRCLWFTSLVSRKENLETISNYLKKGDHRSSKHAQVRKITMGAGTKSASIIMWTFMDETERTEWASRRQWGEGHCH